MYPDTFIDQIRNRLDIADVIGQYIPVSRKGRDYWACCPFHKEKTPSFQIRSDHQVYHCYGCGKHGDIFTFIKEENGVSFSEAVEILAKRAGLELPEQTFNPEEAKKKKTIEKIFAINKEAALFYYNTLKTSAGQPALSYLSERNLTWETIRKFGMGYSPDFDSLPAYLDKKGFDVSSMQEAGVVGINEQGKVYDFFGGRLIIPIINGNGKVLGFTGRLLEKKPDFAKYKNTSTTLAFNKRKNLFGINIFKKFRQDTPRKMILVEGHMDVISLNQAGIPYAVASMGTSLTIEQCREIKRYADIVYVSYDGDSAGQNATIRGLELLKQMGIEIKVVCLTNNLDPDDYVNQYGREGYEKLMQEALPLVDFKLYTVEKHHSFADYDDKVKYAKEALAVLEGSDNVEKEIYLDAVAQKSGLSVEVLKKQTFEKKSEPVVQIQKQTEKEQSALNLAEKFVLSCMYFTKPFVPVSDVKKEYFSDENHKKIIEYIVESVKNGARPRADKLFELTDEEDAGKLIDAQEEIREENKEEYYKQSLSFLKKNYKSKEMKRLLVELNNVSEDQKDEIKQKIADLTRLKV